jgi:outer membrane protein/protease secretion system outer membrane protein
MKAHFRKTSLAVAMSLVASAASSMSLLEAYQMALEQDSTIRASRAALESGRERLPQARSQLLPSVQANVGRNYNDLNTTSPNVLGQETTTNSTYYSFGKTVSLRQPLFNPQRYFQYEQAKDQVADAEATHQRDLQELIVRVGGAYMEALLTEDQLKLVLAQKQQYITLVDAAKKSFKAGAGIRTDIDDAQARLDMALASELEARQNRDYTHRQLEILVNQPVKNLSALNLTGLAGLPTNLPPLESWLEQAQLNSPEIQALVARVSAADKEISKAQSGHSPVLDGIVQWNDSGNENVTRLNSRFATTSLGVQLVVPIFQGGYVSSQVRQAVADKTRMEEVLEATRRDLNLRVHKEHRGVTEGVLKVLALEQAARSAAQLVQSTTKSKLAGVRTTLDILNAEQQLAAAQRDLVQARYLYLMARLRLASLVGKSPLEAITEVAQAFES